MKLCRRNRLRHHISPHKTKNTLFFPHDTKTVLKLSYLQKITRVEVTCDRRSLPRSAHCVTFPFVVCSCSFIRLSADYSFITCVNLLTFTTDSLQGYKDEAKKILPLHIWTTPMIMMRPRAKSLPAVKTSWTSVAQRTLWQFTHVNNTERTRREVMAVKSVGCVRIY